MDKKIVSRKSFRALARNFLVMPVYEYECLKCSLRFDYLVRSQRDIVICPRCNKEDLKKLVSNFSFASKDASGNITSSSSGCSGCRSLDCSSCSR